MGPEGTTGRVRNRVLRRGGDEQGTICPSWGFPKVPTTK